MHDFGVSLRLGIIVSMVSRVKHSIWKGFGSMELDLESFCWGWKIGFGKLKREADEMSRGYRRISTYLTTQGIHQEIRIHELITQGNPPKILENKIYTLPPKDPPRDKKQRTRHSRESTQEREQERNFKRKNMKILLNLN